MAYTSGSKSGMTAAAKAAKRQYSREWRKKNPEKVREYNDRYWQKKAEAANTNR